MSVEAGVGSREEEEWMEEEEIFFGAGRLEGEAEATAGGATPAGRARAPSSEASLLKSSGWSSIHASAPSSSFLFQSFWPDAHWPLIMPVRAVSCDRASKELCNDVPLRKLCDFHWTV